MKFDSWSTEALRGYVVMMGEFLSGSIQEDPLRVNYNDRLIRAREELAVRERAESGEKTSVTFQGEEVTTKEPEPS